MRLRTNSHCTRIGNVDIHQLFQVLELDAGYAVDTDQHQYQHLHINLPNGTGNRGSVSFSPPSLHAIESQLAIIVPCMNEEQHIIEGVLRGIPHECLIIFVSNSALPKFEDECGLLEQLCDDTQRQGIAMHQQNQELARAFCAAGMPEVVNQTGTSQRIRNGKGEAMMIGVLIAKLAGKQYTGFVDADNFVPESVHEYCKVFAAGLQLSLHLSGQVVSGKVSSSPNCTLAIPEAHAMVRIKWNSKPKVVDNQIVFPKTGRSSRVVNEWMNRLLGEIDDGSEIGQDIIQTANAGEHAMDVDLALKLRFATGYAVEPFQYIDILESFGRVPLCDAGRIQADNHEATEHCSSDEPKVRILQIQTCNPHFHDTGKGNEHIERMCAQGLGTIYHSGMTSRMLKDELRVYLGENLPTAVGDDCMPRQLRVYPSMRAIDLDVFRCGMNTQAKTFNCSLQQQDGVVVV